MKKTLIALTLLAISSQSFAALAPYWQSKRELEGVMKLLATSEVSEIFGAKPIVSITRYENLWQVHTIGSCFLPIEVIYTPNPDSCCGPQNFELVPASNKLICTDSDL
jgi:hypothetical protein